MKKAVNMFIFSALVLGMLTSTTNCSLIEAVRENDLSEVKRLIKAGVDLDKQDLNGFTPIHTAVMFEKMPILQVLLKVDDPNKPDRRGFPPLVYAKGYDVVQVLVKAGANVDATIGKGMAQGDNVIHHISTPRALVALLESGASVDAVNRQDESMLKKVAAQETADNTINKQLIATLLIWGADPRNTNVRFGSNTIKNLLKLHAIPKSNVRSLTYKTAVLRLKDLLIKHKGIFSDVKVAIHAEDIPVELRNLMLKLLGE